MDFNISTSNLSFGGINNDSILYQKNYSSNLSNLTELTKQDKLLSSSFGGWLVFMEMTLALIGES